MEQQTIEWESWRKEGLGASDAPIVMGISPWSTPHKLWEIKTGRENPDVGNWATQRGNNLEPKARAKFELIVGLDFPPTLFEHPKYKFMRASLDGWNQENKIVLEIKCPGTEDHMIAATGKIPPKYYPQLQHQLFVTGGTKTYYYSYYENADKTSSSHLIEVLPDIEYQKILFEKMLAFWGLVKKDIEPELTDRDYKFIRDSDLVGLFSQWKETKESFSVLKKRLEDFENKIFEHPDVKGKRVRCGNYRVNLISRKGSIQYAKIPELHGVELEKYRCKNISYQTITFKNPSEESKY